MCKRCRERRESTADAISTCRGALDLSGWKSMCCTHDTHSMIDSDLTHKTARYCLALLRSSLRLEFAVLKADFGPHTHTVFCWLVKEQITRAWRKLVIKSDLAPTMWRDRWPGAVLQQYKDCECADEVANKCAFARKQKRRSHDDVTWLLITCNGSIKYDRKLYINLQLQAVIFSLLLSESASLHPSTLLNHFRNYLFRMKWMHPSCQIQI